MRRWMPILLALAITCGFVWGAKQTSTSGIEPGSIDALGHAVRISEPGLRDAAIGAGLLLLGSWLAGRLVLLIGLPRITGYLLFGALVGPDILAIVTDAQLSRLTLVNDMAIALIALVAGGEIRVRALIKSALAVTLTATFQTLFTVFGVGALIYFGMGALGLGELTDPSQRLAVALLIGVVSAANSPATVIAIIAETHARGPVSRLSLSTAVAMDLVIVALFSVAISFATSAFGAESAGKSGSVALKILMEVLVGAGVGVLMAWVVGALRENLAVFAVLACFAISLLSESIEFDPLIVALIAGLVMENVFPKRTGHTFETLEELSMPVYCVFFAVAGARIDFGIVAAIWPAAVALVVVRALMLSGATVGAMRLAKQTKDAQNWLWSAFLSQAGVLLALAAIIQKTLADHEVGDSVYSLILAGIAINQLAGPIAFKIGLDRVGETGKGSGDDEDEH